MRDFIIVLFIVFAVFGGNEVLNKYLDKSIDELMEIINKMEENITVTKAKKEKIVDELINCWEKYEKVWISFQNHQNINTIEDLLIECYTFYLEEDKTHFLSNARKLNKNMDDLKNREKISFENVL